MMTLTSRTYRMSRWEALARTQIFRVGIGRTLLFLLGSAANVNVGDLLSRVDSKLVATLFDQHGPRVYRRALRLLGNPSDAEEATQEIFIRVVRGGESFQEKSQLTTWLYQITT